MSTENETSGAAPDPGPRAAVGPEPLEEAAPNGETIGLPEDTTFAFIVGNTARGMPFIVPLPPGTDEHGARVAFRSGSIFDKLGTLAAMDAHLRGQVTTMQLKQAMMAPRVVAAGALPPGVLPGRFGGKPNGR